MNLFEANLELKYEISWKNIINIHENLKILEDTKLKYKIGFPSMDLEDLRVSLPCFVLF